MSNLANIEPLHQPDRAVMRAHLEHLFGGFLDGYQDGLIEIAWTSTAHEGGRSSLNHGQMFHTDDIAGAVNFAAIKNGTPGCNVYVGAWLRHPDTPPFGRASDKDAWALTAVYADCDEAYVAQNAKNVYGPDKPTWITITGRSPHTRAQMWWRLEEPLTDHARTSALLRGMAIALSADVTVVNPSRVMRLAGTVAWPAKPGRVVEVTGNAELKDPGPPSYMAEHLEAHFPPVGGPVAAGAIHTGAAVQGGSLSGLGKLSDGRERYMRDTTVAVLQEFMGTCGAVPTAQELFDAAWPQYERNVDLASRPGRGKEEFAQKCAYTLKRFNGGQIRGLENLDVAVAAWRRKQAAKTAADSVVALTPAKPANDPGPFLASSLHGAAPEREWIVPGLIAKGCVNSLYGAGGVGKTLLAQQLAYCLASSRKFLDIEVPKSRVLCVLCEDEKDEVHRRHDALRAGLGLAIGSKALDDVILWPRVGRDNILVAWDQRGGEPRSTPAFDLICQSTLRLRPDLLVLDTLADLFGGNEIIRVQVNHFIKTVLGGLILQAAGDGFNLTVLLLAHPSNAGASSGTGLSGSTAWENAVRSRLYMRRPEDGGDSDERELVVAKANYAAVGDTVIRMMWHEGCFSRVNLDENDVGLRSAKAHALRMVQEAWESGQQYTGKKGHKRFLFSALPKRLAAAGASKGAAMQAVRELVDGGEIYLNQNHKKRGYRVAGGDDENE